MEFIIIDTIGETHINSDYVDKKIACKLIKIKDITEVDMSNNKIYLNERGYLLTKQSFIETLNNICAYVGVCNLTSHVPVDLIFDPKSVNIVSIFKDNNKFTTVDELESHIYNFFKVGGTYVDDVVVNYDPTEEILVVKGTNAYSRIFYYEINLSLKNKSVVKFDVLKFDGFTLIDDY